MDTIIIGGGLAGLTAARALAARNRSVTLLEARTRLGGRVFTHREPGIPAPVELGAEWFPRGGEMHTLLSEANLTIGRETGTHVRSTGGVVEDADDFPAVASVLLTRLSHLPGEDRSLRDALAECFAAGEHEEERKTLLAYAEGFHAADPSQLSTRWVVQTEDGGSAAEAELRTPNGLGAGVQFLSESVNGSCATQLKTVVRELRWEPGAVQVTADGGSTFSARTAIITVPLPLLTRDESMPGSVRIHPDIPEKRAAVARLRMGQAVKVVLRFRDPFWRRLDRLDDVGYLFAFDEPFPAWWTGPGDGVAQLTAWAGGPKARALRNVPGSGVADAVLDSLSRVLAMRRSDVEAHLASHHFHDWRSDPFTMGAYTYAGVGGMEAIRELAAPVDDTLFFAGEATAEVGLVATMDGACASGARAAGEALAALENEP
jgi:monoamine oxidase